MNSDLLVITKFVLLMCGAFAVGGAIATVEKWVKQRRRKAPAADPLDTVLMEWSPGDPLTVRHWLNSTVIFGRTGSGKTSGSGRMLMRWLVNYPKSSGLFLAAKPEDVDDIREVFQRAGRLDDLIVFNPDGERRCNFIDYVRKMGGDTRDITKCITTIGESLRSNDNKGGGEMGDFWENEQARMIHNAVEVVKLATGTVTAPHLQKFILTAPQYPEHVTKAEWKGCFHDKCTRAAFEKKKTPVQKHDFELALDYWFKEYPSMADKTRSSILTCVLGLLHVFNSGIVREIVSTTTNVSPDDMLQGRWVLINMPPSQWGDSGSFVNAGWKYLTQKMILRRKASPGDCVVTIWSDEFQQFCNSHDPHFLAQSRSHLGCMVALTQSLPGILAKMKGKTGAQEALSLLSNFTTKIFHACDAQTAQYASELIGRKLQMFNGASMPPEEDLFSALIGKTKFSGSFNSQFEYELQPSDFLSLRTGGQAADCKVDAVVFKSGEPFASGANWRYATFSQK